MTPETLAKANEIDNTIEFLRDSLHSWENRELPKGSDRRGDMLSVPYAGITPAAWITFRDACKTELQRQIDAKCAELASL